MQFVNGGQSNSVKIHSTFLHVSRHGIYSVPLGSDSAQFHHYKPVQKQHVHPFTATRCSKAPSVAEIAFVIFKKNDLLSSHWQYLSALLVPGGILHQQTLLIDEYGQIVLGCVIHDWM